ncbi:MAG TPA: hypothetical protein VKT78_05335 [Fimbriimonadaceae bacterium]|nr:hypothetical protein [Fimbriimonadaceae bacterium]
MITSLLLGLVTAATRTDAAFEQVAVSPTITVSLPKSATPLKADAPDPSMKLWSYTDGTASYIVSTHPLTDEELAKATPDMILGNSVLGACGSMSHPNIKLHRDVLLNGWPGVETLIVSDNKYASAMRSFVVGKSLYMLCETYAATSGRPDGVDTFLGSLVISPAPAAGPLETPGPVFKAFAPEDGKLSILMPATPKKSETAMPGWDAQYGDRFYTVGYLDMPADAPAPAEALPLIKQKLIEGMKAKATKSSTFTRDGLEFNSTEVSISELCAGRIDLGLSGGRLYVVMMIYPTGHAGSKDIDTFFNSFKVSK